MPQANDLLAALSGDVQRRLQPHLEPMRLARKTVLYEIGDTMQHGYFPLSGLVSSLGMTRNGDTVEVASVGNEGVVGLPLVCQADTALHQAVVQIQGLACRVRADVLRDQFRSDEGLRDVLLRYAGALLHQAARFAVCHRFHTTAQRLCRTLLVAHDHARSDTLDLTQEFIAQVLGIPRTGVTAAAVALQDAGAIRYRHGKIAILDRRMLERQVCECYALVGRQT